MFLIAVVVSQPTVSRQREVLAPRLEIGSNIEMV